MEFSNQKMKTIKMAPKMQPEVISREFVKPSFSTPNNHPSVHNLSFFDQIVPSFYVPLLFFYTSKNGETDHHRSTVLKISLSAALSHYYPLAGRIKDDVTVNCNDEGALFLEARLECNCAEILNNPDDEILKLLFPDSLYYKDSTLTGPVAVQVTYFKCGGMSIGICLSHKTLDMSSMTFFIKEWASLARNSEKEISPEFNIGSLYPPLDLPILTKKQEAPPVVDCVSRRIVFNGLKISNLKEMVANQVPNPTRVEVVTSLLYKSAISANAKATSSYSLKPNFMNHAMNLRTKISPALSERNIGNLIGMFPVLAREDTEIELGVLVKEFRKAKTQFSNSCANTISIKDICPLILESMKPLSEYLNVELYVCTSWCRYPFYESDFGWGKPLWVATILMNWKNFMILVDTKEGDGIEAFISLEEKAMAVFENDEELLSFCCINPSVSD
ncbi:BAHD acyltransferase At5g47980-like [Euphorbia lathyris]|uniref:BAHD acyltransferase At5g47980-like n=1 Tax=Euphorbia lathyris TaxID=212925 RepID=UPI0033135E82